MVKKVAVNPLQLHRFMKIVASYMIFSVLLYSGCASHSYINAVPLSETPRINPTRAGNLPKRLTVAQLFREWGPASGGKELIYSYRTTSDSSQIIALAAPKDDEIEWTVKDAEIIKIILTQEGHRPIVLWESEIKDAAIDRLLER